VLINLFNNSADAIRDLKNKWIELNFDVKGNIFTITFTDSGHGIPKDLADKIMHPFFTTKAPNKGTGLGLSIAKNLIETHGGNFWLDAAHPHTRFIFELMIQPQEMYT
jgi:C4-dicarboxylate-specific signal transduction histidine kinase